MTESALVSHPPALSALLTGSFRSRSIKAAHLIRFGMFANINYGVPQCNMGI